MPALSLRSLVPGVVFLSLAVLCGCGKESSTGTAPTTGGNDRSVASADSLLALVLYDELNSSPQRPSDVNFGQVYDYYYSAFQSAEVSAAGRVRARFGLAVIGLLILTSDTEANAAFDEWRAYLEAHVPFEVTPPSPHAPLGIPAGFTSPREALALPFDVVSLSLVSLARSPLGTPDPQLSRVQAILRDRALPRLVEAIVHLDAVAADASFTFIVTPGMQGDPAADPVEIDHTDILALRAACKLLAAACRVAVSYQLSFPAYDEASLLAAIQPGSSWLALAPGGAGQMGSAHLDLLGSVDDVSAAIGSLLAESDPQDNDVIRIGPGAVSHQSLDSVRTRLPQVRQALASGYTLRADWDGNPVTPDVPLTIRPGALFTNPVPDWKAMLPPYTGSTQHRAVNTQWVYNYESVQVPIAVATAGTYSGGYSLSVAPGTFYEYPYGDTQVSDAIRSLIATRFSAVSKRTDWAESYYASTSFFGALSAGSNNVSVLLNESYSLAGSTIAIPVITWNATSFSQWVWPDPTFRGLLPGLTTTGQLFSTFGIEESQWARVWVLDWSRYASGPPVPPPPPAPLSRGRGPASVRAGF